METSISAFTPSPPYYAVIFTSLRTYEDNGYSQMSEQISNLAKISEGFLGVESFRNNEGFGVTISYWKNTEVIKQWKQQENHLLAQKYGKEKWYSHYKIRISKVERDYEFNL